jgi:putative YhbY family RNA-binding protein
VVSVASHGLTAGVMAEIDRALTSHELIKVRIYGEDRASRTDLMATICEQLAAEPVQHIGNILVLWREKPAESPAAAPQAPKPSARATPEADFARSARARALASARRGARQASPAHARPTRQRPHGPRR